MNLIIKSIFKRARNEINLIRHNKKEICLLATMPKSGTWYAQYFFWALKKFLHDHELNINEINFHKEKIKNYIYINKSFLLIGHASNPGYVPVKDKKYGNKWQKKTYWNNGYYFLNREMGKSFNPNYNKEVRIIYLYRKPLTQFFSMYNYNFNHKSKFYREISKFSFSDFVIKVSAADSFLKQFHTHKILENCYPDNIKLINFEKLVSNPEETFFEICDFYNIFDNTVKYKNIIKKAARFCKRDNLKIIEKKIGHSLANDRLKRGSHIQDYNNSYTELISEEDLKIIEELFNEFNYSLKDF